MIIELPKEFSMEKEGKGRIAFIENGILYLTRQTDFRKVMAKITYKIKGDDECQYCHKTVSKDKIEMTVDHMFPLEMGGPTITDNLLPACKGCNSKKKNMTCEQFLIYESKGDREAKQKYLNQVLKFQEELRKRKVYQIPQEWMENVGVDDIIVNMKLYEAYIEKRYLACEKYYFKYGTIQKPIIVDRNSFLLDGFFQIMVAKNNNVKSVPAIMLENVEVLLRTKED